MHGLVPYHTIENAFQSDRLLLKELDDDNSGEISFEEFAPQEAPFDQGNHDWVVLLTFPKDPDNMGPPCDYP